MKKNRFLFSTLVVLGLTLGLTTVNNASFALAGSDNLTVNVDVPNTIQVTLASGTLSFATYTGALEKTATVKVTVDSGLNYDLNGRFTSDIQTADLVNKIPYSAIMVCGDTVPQAVAGKNIDFPLSTNHVNGLGIAHWITVQLEPNTTVKSASYSGTLQIEATQL